MYALTSPGYARVLACLLVAGMNFPRLAHMAHAGHIDAPGPVATHEEHSGLPHQDPANLPASHDSDDCPICHFIASGSIAIAAARSVSVAAARPIDRQRPPVVVEPHSADVPLTQAARAPPVA